MNSKEIEDLHLQGSNYIHPTVFEETLLDPFLEKRFPKYVEEKWTWASGSSSGEVLIELRGKYLTMLATHVLLSDVKLDVE